MALWAGGGQKLFNWGMRWEHWSGNERGRSRMCVGELLLCLNGAHFLL